MFRGINAINLDPKGRIMIPARFRERLCLDGSTHIILTIDPKFSCLLLYPAEEWRVIEQKVSKLPSLNPATRRIQRLLIGHATEIDIDNAGRILLPPLLRQHAQLRKRVMLVGQCNKFEIWDECIWTQERDAWIATEAESQNQDDLPEGLQDLTL